MRSFTAGIKAAAAAAAVLLLAEGAYLLGSWAPHRRSGVFDLYLIGGSVAGGVPYSYDTAYGPIAAAALGGAVDRRPILPRMILGRRNLLFDDLVTLEQTLRARPRSQRGALLIYAGGNVRPEDPRAALRARALDSAARRLRFSALASDAVRRVQAAFGWEGGGPAALEAQLRRAIESARRAGVATIVVGKAVNLAGREPPQSPEHLASAGPGLLRALDEGLALERAGRHARALAHHRAAARRMPAAERVFLFRAGRCLLALGRRQEARQAFASARPDLWQEARAVNEIASRVAADLGAPFIDSQRLMDSASDAGVAGNELFADDSHPNTRGHAVLGLAVARELARLFSQPVPGRAPALERIYARARLSREQRACAAATTAFGAIRDFVGYPRPVERLAVAQAAAREAVALAPHEPAGQLARGLVEEARRRGDVLGPFEMGWLKTVEIGTVPCLRSHVPAGELSALLERWRAAGVPESMSAELRRAAGTSR